MGIMWRTAKVASCTRRAVNKGPVLTNSASGRSRSNAAKAAPISRPLLALRTWICRAIARAVDSTSCNVELCNCLVGRIDKHRHTGSCGYHLAQQGKPLRHQLSRENINPCQVATGPGEADDKTEPDRVFCCNEKDRDRRCRRLRRERRRLTYGCDNSDPAANQIVSESRQLIKIPGGAVSDRNVLVLDKACLLETLPESAQKLLVLQYGGEDPDHRYRRLLGPRNERPCRRHTAQNS